MKRILTRTLRFVQFLVCVPFGIVGITVASTCAIAISFVCNGFDREEWTKDWKMFKAMLEIGTTEDD